MCLDPQFYRLWAVELTATHPYLFFFACSDLERASVVSGVCSLSGSLFLLSPVRVYLRRIYSTRMQTPPNLNDQHTWGGQPFRHAPTKSPSVANEQDQPTLIARGHQTTQTHPLSQAGFIASSSDNLFHPVNDVPSSYVYSLPPIPSAPCRHAYNSSNTFHRPLPYRSPYSSYNNPNFAVPPSLPHDIPLSPVNQLSEPVVPVSPRNFSQPAYIPPQPVHHQPAYHFQPAYHPQPTYPPSYNQPQNNFPPIPHFYHNQPVYPPALQPPEPLHVPSPSPSPVSSLSKTLPTVSHIPILTSKLDFFAWDEGVNALIRANGLLGHILDPSSYVDPIRPDLAPRFPPVLTLTSSARDIIASNR